MCCCVHVCAQAQRVIEIIYFVSCNYIMHEITEFVKLVLTIFTECSNLIYSCAPNVCVCVCVRQRQTERQRDRESVCYPPTHSA